MSNRFSISMLMAVIAALLIVPAFAAAQGTGPYARIDEWMRPAVARGLSAATVAAVAILALGFLSLRLAARSSRTS